MTILTPTYEQKRNILESAGLLVQFDGDDGFLDRFTCYTASAYKVAFRRSNALQKKYIKRLYKESTWENPAKDFIITHKGVLCTKQLWRLAYACDQIIVSYLYADYESKALLEMANRETLPEGFSDTA